ncbi:MAG: TetR/AcrR family transcriptional regulator [Gammaproteobacteria bacterium]|nr:TetR/AcrR family transcriptional regulator [Gammaproteobacteria bacterium]
MAFPEPAGGSARVPTPQRILAAATRLFGERGYDSVSVTAIAAEAGVSKANIFHHFKSKRELYLSVLRAACAESAALLEEGEGTGRGFAERLARFLDGHLAHVYQHAGLTRLILRELIEDEPGSGQELAEEALGHSFTRLVALLRDGQAQGALREDIDPAMLALLMVGANVFFFQVDALIRHFPDIRFADDRGAYSRMLADILWRGIDADRARAAAGAGG